jgi:CRP/FNR family transcriptional regulator, anaerobic regulatory protein
MSIEAFIKQHIPGYENVDFVLPFEVEQKNINPKSVIIEYGQLENKIHLLTEGVVQVSTLKGDEERILEFAFPGEFFGAYTSFLLQQPSDVQIISLSKCRVSIIKRESLLRSNQNSLVSSHLSLYVAQQLFLSRARREKDFLTLSAEERYLKLLEKDSELIKTIPVKKIASYLGIKAESLSRIRRSIIP